MRRTNFLIFILVVIVIFTLGNYYILAHGFRALSPFGFLQYGFILVCILLSFSFFAHRFLAKTKFYKLHHIVYFIGSLWFAALLYFLLASFLADLTGLFNHIFHFLQAANQIKDWNLYSLLASIVIVFAIVLYGIINARKYTVRKFELQIHKSAGKYRELKIALVSDMHMGSLVSKKRIADMVESINKEEPDLVLLAGDLMDEVHEPIFRMDIGSPIKNIVSKLGIYAIHGNHEFIGGIEAADAYLKSLHIELLKDQILLIDNSFYLAGREDRSILGFKGKVRKSLKEMVENRNEHIPLILMDHQPFELNEAVQNKVDIQFSGHTHHGQLWPINFITNKMYELSHGYKKIQDTHFYVSCGFGTWGPPVRIGSRPEIVIFLLKFQ